MYMYALHTLYGDLFQRTLHQQPLTMSTTSQKHRNFVAEPMGEKEVSCRHWHKKETLSDEYFHQVTDLAGIGDVLGKRLSGKGFDKVNIGNGDKFELI